MDPLLGLGLLAVALGTLYYAFPKLFARLAVHAATEEAKVWWTRLSGMVAIVSGGIMLLIWLIQMAQ